MKKLFISSDVHSFYTEWMDALNNAGFDIDDQKHIIVHCGDLLDRGKEAVKCLNFVNSLPENRKILICGNHEVLLDMILKRCFAISSDHLNGTVNTIEQCTNIYGHIDSAINEFKTYKPYADYKEQLRWYYEVGNYIFVHGWIPYNYYNSKYTFPRYEYNPEWRNASKDDWKEIAIWSNGMEAWHNGILEKEKTIFCGHWHASFGHSHYHNMGSEFVNEGETRTYIEELDQWVPFAIYTPFIDKGIVALDACTVVSSFVNVFTIEIDEKTWLDSQKNNTYIYK